MTNKTTSAIDLVERVARAISIPEHHTSWDTLSETEKDLYRMQAEYAVKAFDTEQADTITRLQAALDDMRLQGQGEGFAAAVQWLRDRSACKPRAPLWSAANELADAMEQSRRPGSSVRASA